MAKANREEWAKRVQRWQDSGLSAREFEGESGLKATSLNYWRWRLKKEQAVSDGEQPTSTVASARKRTPKPMQFVEVSALTAAVSDDRFDLVVGAFTIRIPSRFDEKSLRKLLAIVAERS